MLFDNLSPKTDFSSKITIQKLDILMSNVLYITHEVDKIKKLVAQIDNSLGVQKQVDDYFSEDTHKHIPEEETGDP